MSSNKFNIASFARAAEENAYNDDDNNIRHEDEFFENDEMRQHQDDFKDRKSGPSFVQEDRKDWKPRHQDLEGERDKGVVPAEWRYGQQEVQRKGDKNTFYCEVCHVELNSLETMKSHANGAKHQKKMLSLESERIENLRRGILPGEKMPGIKPIPNPASAKVKIPMRLQERIKTTQEPVVGLKHVQEFLTESDPEMEPHYQCGLCGSQGTSNSMFSHLMGGKHRQKTAEALGVARGFMSQGDLLKFAKQYSENAAVLTRLITTTVSDARYPAWPAGKAPWAVERGGAGVCPGQETLGLPSKREREAPASSASTRLQLPRDLRAETSEEADRMIEAGRRMMEMALRSQYSGVDIGGQNQILSSLDLLLEKYKSR